VRSIGEEIIAGLKELISDIKNGKPRRQYTVRRMTVRGKTVYVHDSFTAPIGKLNQGTK
jgi:hypothetical protein